MVTGKGLMAFMLTLDDSAASVAKVAAAVVDKLSNRKRAVATNHQKLMEALQLKLPKWGITLM